MSIYLIRHGLSKGNAQGVGQGLLDYPLTDLGRRQAAAVGAWLAERGVRPAVVYTSPLLRARMTAQEIAAALALAEPIERAELREYSLGELEGKTKAEATARFPNFPNRNLAELIDFAPYGGESRESVQQRLQGFIALIEGQHKAEDVVAVGHGGSLYQLISLWCARPVPEHIFIRLANCCCLKLELCEIGGHPVAQIQWYATLELIAPELS